MRRTRGIKGRNGQYDISTYQLNHYQERIIQRELDKREEEREIVRIKKIYIYICYLNCAPQNGKAAVTVLVIVEIR